MKFRNFSEIPFLEMKEKKTTTFCNSNNTTFEKPPQIATKKCLKPPQNNQTKKTPNMLLTFLQPMKTQASKYLHQYYAVAATKNRLAFTYE